MTEDLFAGETTFTEFELETANQIATAAGRSKPNKVDMELAVEKAQKWNKHRASIGLPVWV